jgi:hypothetical protein
LHVMPDAHSRLAGLFLLRQPFAGVLNGVEHNTADSGSGAARGGVRRGAGACGRSGGAAARDRLR